MPNLSKTKIVAALLVGLAAFSQLAAESEPVAQFLADDSRLDEFPGGGGEGWQDEWKVLYPRAYERQFAVEVSESDPFPGSARRLEIRSLEQAKGRNILLSRVLDAGAFDSAKPYTVAFKVRMDSVEPAGENFSFTFSGQHEGGGWGPSDSAWFLYTQKGYWFVVGRIENSDGLDWKRLPLALVAGEVYSFLIHVDPAGGTYRVEISDGVETAESPEMRSYKPVDPVGVANLLLFRAATSEAAERFVWSLSDLEIRAVK